MQDCLIISDRAAALQKEIERSSDDPPAVLAFGDAESAVAAWSGERIILGNPDLVAAALPRLGDIDWVQSTWAGIRPLVACQRRDYLLTGIKDVFGPQMSEYVFGHLLAIELKLAERRAAQAQKRWWDEHSRTLAGKRLGIMGTGSIGAHIAATGRHFGLTVHGLSRTGRPADPFDTVRGASELHAFLGDCDYLVSTLPDTPATDALLDTAALAALPRGAMFVNVGRGNVVDSEALVAALGRGHLAAAVLDVFDEEPLPPGSPLWDAPNVTITAHVAAASYPALIAPIFLDNYRRFRAGKPLCHVVSLEHGY